MALQTPLEERWNTITHAVGAILGIIGLLVLVFYDSGKTIWSLFSVVVYGLSIIVLFTASTFYHAVSKASLKRKLRVLDHISIYLLIAGTYTPVLLILLEQSSGWTLFYIVWGIAAFGVILKLFFTGKFEVFSTLLYLIMGWLIAFDYSTLEAIMPTNGLYLLWAGGLFYTLGIIFYVVHKIPYNHVIWHFFVLGGAICHFFMVWLYVV